MKGYIALTIFLAFCGAFGEVVVEGWNSAAGWWVGKAMKCLGGASVMGVLIPILRNFKLLHGGTLDKDMATTPLPPAELPPINPEPEIRKIT